jgi:3-isopropylmalate/(R)-2-methylmalate dehydratase small subunit
MSGGETEMTETDATRKEFIGRAIVVRGNDMDTDRIIPARYLRTVTFEHLGAHAFEDDRVGGGHPFDEERFQGASILLVNKNFGCGSSREHAPQALMRWGIDVFVGESFAEIFFGNCVALGLPCLKVSEADAATLMDAVEADPTIELTLDVAAGLIRFGDTSVEAFLPEGTRDQLVRGTWDALGELLQDREAISKTADRLPYITGF